MLPRWDPDSPRMLPAIICYADILGYRGMAEEAFNSSDPTQFLLALKRSLKTAYGIVHRAQTHEWGGDSLSFFEMKIFTDNIVVAYPLYDPGHDLGEPELGDLLMTFSNFQASLASDGFFTRGGLTFSDHYQDDSIVYGEAFLEAYDLDQKGGMPRLVIGSSLEELLAEQLNAYGDGPAPHHEHLLEDPKDNVLFINYLEVAFDYLAEGYIDFDLLEAHKKNVEKGLRDHAACPSVREKYEWLATYHNYICREFGEEPQVLDFLVEFQGNWSPRRLNRRRLQERLDD